MDRHKGVRITNTHFSGHQNMVMPTLIRSISAVCRADRAVGRYYIGVASGPDYWQALTRRVDERKIAQGVTDMYLLYRSSSETVTRSVERALLLHFQEFRSDERIWNAVRGGGGRRGSGPEFFVYLAVSRS